MKLRLNSIILLCFIASAYISLATGIAISAITPDATIHAALKSLFSAPPQVHGFPYQDLLETASIRYGLPLPYVLAVVRGESFFDPKAKSAKGAIGLMQVLPSTAADYGVKPEDLFDPAINIDVGVHYLADIHSKLKDPYLSLAAYYCGCGGVEKSQLTLRKDCDEYVSYIHAHLQKILETTANEGPTPGKAAQRLLLAHFDNFLDAESFVRFLSMKLPAQELEIFSKEVVHMDHVRNQYQVLVAFGKSMTESQIYKAVEDVTGFSFCQQNN